MRPFTALLGTCAAALIATSAVAQQPLHDPCLQNANDANAAIEAFMEAGWSVPDADALQVAHTVIGEQYRHLRELLGAPETVEEWQSRLDFAETVGREHMEDVTFLHRGADAVAVATYGDDPAVHLCLIAGQDLSGVDVSLDEARHLARGNRLGASQFEEWIFPVPGDDTRVAVVWHLQSRQDFEVPFVSPGNEMITLRFRGN